jgi:AraC-like DNA-binding protein
VYPRAARYFARAGRINAIAAEMGYESLEHAIRAGRMREIFQRVSPPASDAAEGAHL